jgi:hypothetical protein
MRECLIPNGLSVGLFAAEILIRGLGREQAQKTQEKEILRMPRFCVLCASLRLDCCG